MQVIKPDGNSIYSPGEHEEDGAYKSNMFDACKEFKALASICQQDLRPLGIYVAITWVNEVGNESWCIYTRDPKTNLEYVPLLTENWFMNAGIDPYDVLNDLVRDILESYERGEEQYLAGR